VYRKAGPTVVFHNEELLWMIVRAEVAAVVIHVQRYAENIQAVQMVEDAEGAHVVAVWELDAVGEVFVLGGEFCFRNADVLDRGESLAFSGAWRRGMCSRCSRLSHASSVSGDGGCASGVRLWSQSGCLPYLRALFAGAVMKLANERNLPRTNSQYGVSRRDGDLGLVSSMKLIVKTTAI
jgi:hypothetical protein